ncbi:uracil-DNA glycosylase [Bordetella pseudohinzii]|nr:uracil-DNA glycosylase [Bordetella pseudohinzii]ANY18201.1 uracil-DNA glycosylase [Bordetella pseudohinzii]KMM27260.1 DNA polymerase [Bordetella pseudohinzii]KXA79471.1 DNA polymerase [Bordetella pseudohinzii]KXA82759.1 DNA polymerase [Bordetella pseudohinzii]
MAELRVNPLQRLWLREIGIEKTWLRGAPDSAPAPARDVQARPAVTAQAPPAARSAPEAPRPSRPEPRPASKPEPAPTVAEASAPASAGIEVARRVAGFDLAQLQQEVLACTACGLCQGRKHAVFGDGARPARWLVVGEAPGEQEDRRGLPFVGRSGQLLDAMLASVGMSRERDVFIANVIKCRPPGNRNPKPEEIAACSPYLMRQIALLEPERILVLGRFAAQTLLGTDATIGSLRGRRHVLKTEAGREIPVVVSYHPAYLLRSPSEKARAWQDLQLALRAA